jgi:protein-S-isoprenylcysteine O-methyltransferase Ste14
MAAYCFRLAGWTSAAVWSAAVVIVLALAAGGQVDLAASSTMHLILNVTGVLLFMAAWIVDRAVARYARRGEPEDRAPEYASLLGTRGRARSRDPSPEEHSDGAWSAARNHEDSS